jgi:hypothetical protein
MLWKIAVVLNEGIKLRERREEKKERSSHRNYLHMSGCLRHVLRHRESFDRYIYIPLVPLFTADAHSK